MSDPYASIAEIDEDIQARLADVIDRHILYQGGKHAGGI
jgi:hypothetical protein